MKGLSLHRVAALSLAAFLLSVGLVLATASAALANHNPGHRATSGNPDGNSGQQGEDYFVGVTRSGPGNPGVGGGADPCDYWRMDYLELQQAMGALVGSNYNPDLVTTEEDNPEAYEFEWIWYICPGAPGFIANLGFFQLGDPPPTDTLQDSALRLLIIPLPTPEFSPDQGITQLVGLETWLWIAPGSAATQIEQACIPDNPPYYACATATAEFLDIAFDMGDGSPEINCGGIGIAYNLGVSYEDQAGTPHCGYVYIEVPDSGTYPVIATSIWDISWTCLYDGNPGDGVAALDTSCGGGPIDTAGRSNLPVILDIGELQARATADGQ